jgi:hypothetical protein
LGGRLILGYQKSLPAQYTLTQEGPLTFDVSLTPFLLGNCSGGYTSYLS